eukprot:TRINITY_DN3906_c0_g1_i6.p1 TRINITY_DN3906_c0_g1~~TRINITY_DN3906_c0_g1_i6.p1  ORF type:complete len:211 (-),score=48.99 TRINITY_DN3906_c0_g1_i6:272-904(-)
MASELSRFIEDELTKRGLNEEEKKSLVKESPSTTSNALRFESRVREQQESIRAKTLTRNLCIIGGILLVVVVWIVLLSSSGGQTETTPPANSTQPMHNMHVHSKDHAVENQVNETQTTPVAVDMSGKNKAEDGGNQTAEQTPSKESLQNDETKNDTAIAATPSAETPIAQNSTTNTTNNEGGAQAPQTEKDQSPVKMALEGQENKSDDKP